MNIELKKSIAELLRITKKLLRVSVNNGLQAVNWIKTNMRKSLRASEPIHGEFGNPSYM